MPNLTNFPALDVAIGLIFVYATLALIVTGLSELIARVTSMRAKFLEKGLRNLLNDPQGTDIAKKLLEHPLIRGLSRHGAVSDATPAKPPSYIPSKTFAVALLDTIAPPSDANDTSDVIAAASTKIGTIGNPQVEKALQSLLRGARGNLDSFRTAIEGWYDETMNRVAGWYKRRVQVILIVLGILAAGALNADSVQIASSLWNDGAVRAAVVAEATKAQQPPGSAEKKLQRAGEDVNKLNSLALPIGWHDAKGDPRKPPSSFWSWVAKILGILVTGFAISLGAPFWFDALGKATRLKSTGPKPEPSSGS